MDLTVSSRYCTPRFRGMGLACLLVLVASNHPRHAAVTNALIDGNFELQTGNGESQTVSNWFESTRNQTTTTGSALADAGQFPAAQSNIVNFSNPNGYTWHHQFVARVVATTNTRTTRLIVRVCLWLDWPELDCYFALSPSIRIPGPCRQHRIVRVCPVPRS